MSAREPEWELEKILLAPFELVTEDVDDEVEFERVLFPVQEGTSSLCGVGCEIEAAML